MKIANLPLTEATIDTLSHDGRGIALLNGKKVFIHDALPQEKILFRYTKRHKQYDEGQTVEVLSASPHRVTPACPQFSVCGGCVLQHASADFQRQHKESVLFEQLAHFGQVESQQRLAPLAANDYGYRGRARLGVRVIPKTNEMVVGFRERHGRYLTRTEHCSVLDKRIGEKITALKNLCDNLSVRAQLPQIEVVATGNTVGLIFRVLQPLTDNDKKLLTDFGHTENFCIEIEPNKPEPIYRLTSPQSDAHLPSLPSDAHFSYTLDNNITLDFQAGDFTQVNAKMNVLMVKRVSDLLALKPTDHVLELFSGIGNFTLPLAQNAGRLTAVEGSEALVARAKTNAEKNKLSNIDFFVANLFESPEKNSWWKPGYSAVLLDPPRVGAEAVCQMMGKLKVPKIIYISCHPATLARDAKILVHEQGYKLITSGIMDMFPQTSHVEAIAVFEK